MRTLADLQAAVIEDEDGHWIFKGALSDGWPRIWAPDFTSDPSGKTMRAQTGGRAIWHMREELPVPKRWRVYSLCNVKGCIHPDHIACGPMHQVGRHFSKAGVHKTTAHRAASRASALKKTHLTKDKIEEIVRGVSLGETGQSLAARLNLGRTVVSRAKHGKAVAAQVYGGLGDTSGNPFAGLLVLAESAAKRKPARACT